MTAHPCNSAEIESKMAGGLDLHDKTISNLEEWIHIDTCAESREYVESLLERVRQHSAEHIQEANQLFSEQISFGTAGKLFDECKHFPDLMNRSSKQGRNWFYPNEHN